MCVVMCVASYVLYHKYCVFTYRIICIVPYAVCAMCVVSSVLYHTCCMCTYRIIGAGKMCCAMCVVSCVSSTDGMVGGSHV